MEDSPQGFNMDTFSGHRLVYFAGLLWAYLIGYAGGPRTDVLISEAKEPSCERGKMLLSAGLFYMHHHLLSVQINTCILEIINPLENIPSFLYNVHLWELCPCIALLPQLFLFIYFHPKLLLKRIWPWKIIPSFVLYTLPILLWLHLHGSICLSVCSKIAIFLRAGRACFSYVSRVISMLNGSIQ